MGNLCNLQTAQHTPARRSVSTTIRSPLVKLHSSLGDFISTHLPNADTSTIYFSCRTVEQSHVYAALTTHFQRASISNANVPWLVRLLVRDEPLPWTKHVIIHARIQEPRSAVCLGGLNGCKSLANIPFTLGSPATFFSSFRMLFNPMMVLMTFITLTLFIFPSLRPSRNSVSEIF